MIVLPGELFLRGVCVLVGRVKVREGPEYCSRFASLHKGVVSLLPQTQNTSCRNALSVYSLCRLHLLFSKTDSLIHSDDNSVQFCSHSCDYKKKVLSNLLRCYIPSEHISGHDVPGSTLRAP